jgi:membrane fusion protein, multidrug efflux system
VPSAAVQLGPNGAFVYVLNRDSTVSVRLVSVTQQDEARTVITKGLQASEPVVTSGFAQLAEGRKVSAAGAEEKRGADAERERGAATNSFDYRFGHPIQD